MRPKNPHPAQQRHSDLSAYQDYRRCQFIRFWMERLFPKSRKVD